jgi:hypothetical protein
MVNIVRPHAGAMTFIQEIDCTCCDQTSHSSGYMQIEATELKHGIERLIKQSKC